MSAGARLCPRGEVALLLRDLERMRVEMGGAENVELAPVPPPGMDQFERGQFDLATLMSEIRGTCKEIEEEKSHSGSSKLPAPVRIARDNDLKKKVKLLAEGRKSLQEDARRDPKHQGDFEELDRHIRKTQEYYGRASGTVGPASIRAAPALASAEGPRENMAPMLTVDDDEEFKSLMQTVRSKDQEIDTALTAIEAGVGGIIETTRAISTELNIQDRMLDGIEDAVDRQQVALDGLNVKVKRVLEEVNSESVCMYILCCTLILAVCAGIFALMRG